ncbi:uncharacterized protein LOC117606557 [Osmia lignaria lignaria]|uniref:uncharacterized protein LOC117606557 n=1 Tax=Osmia lignaria lignaria TaxID=1437193 RepID=UPI00402B292B
MGQAWCKEKSTKAQDSKSPLDRVFVRCAHRIYPGLKEEGSVLGGATQRVTSSEIGYAGSPPREVLTRGRSIDSVDRPFHPSDWVDVNLEVPSTPRGSPVLTNLTVDTSLHPTSTDSNSKNETPIPPPRRRKKNKGRPLPPKPDEATENSSSNSKGTETNEEPLYSSVKSPKSSGDEQDEETGKQRCTNDGRRTKEIYEHKVNGTGRIISSDVVSGKRTSRIEEKKSQRSSESNHHHHQSIPENDEYERFASNRTSKDSSTPNREEKMKESSSNARAKNYSTVSLPNYDELDVARHRTMEIEEADKGKKKPRRPVRSSTGSLPAASYLSPFSEKTSVRLEDYIPSQGSPDNLSAYQLLQKLNCGQEEAFVKYETASKSQDWDFGDIGNCELNHQQPSSPYEVIIRVEDENIREQVDEDVVDFSGDNERKSPADPDVSNSSICSEKAEAFGKASPVVGELEYSEVDPNRSAEIRSQTRHFDPPTLVDSCRVSLAHDSSTSKEPFFLDEKKHRSALDAIGGSCMNGESIRTSTIFTRSLSIESEPNEDACETKDLQTGLIRSISEESLPKEMLEEQQLDQLFDEKLAKDVHNKLKKSLDWKTKTPPPSPEPKTRSEPMDLDHSTLLKVLKEEAAEESNLSSMTPSLTELEAALSDMLEREECQEGSIDEKNSAESVARTNQSLAQESKGKNDAPVCLGQILKERKPATGRKVSFCSWEEAVAQSGNRSDWEFTERPVDLDKRTVSHPNDDPRDSIGDGVACPMDLPPEKPSRLNRSLDDSILEMPTPPKRRNRSLQLAKKDALVEENGSAYFNDRLI